MGEAARGAWGCPESRGRELLGGLWSPAGLKRAARRSDGAGQGDSRCQRDVTRCLRHPGLIN